MFDVNLLKSAGIQNDSNQSLEQAISQKSDSRKPRLQKKTFKNSSVNSSRKFFLNVILLLLVSVVFIFGLSKLNLVKLDRFIVEKKITLH